MLGRDWKTPIPRPMNTNNRQQGQQPQQHAERVANVLSLASPPSNSTCFGGGSNVDPSRVACGIWLNPEQGRTMQELQTMDRIERERVWADLVGDTKETAATSSAPAAVGGSSAQSRSRGDASMLGAMTTSDNNVVHDGDDDIDDVTDDILNQLRQELGKIAESSATVATSSFHKAMEQNSSYVFSPFFLRRMLRSDNLDIKATVKRILLHFEVKEQIFGPDLLGRDVTIDDMTEDDINALKSGGFYFGLGPCDHAKRQVFFWRYASLKYKKTENMVRCCKGSEDVACTSFSSRNNHFAFLLTPASIQFLSITSEYPPDPCHVVCDHGKNKRRKHTTFRFGISYISVG